MTRPHGRGLRRIVFRQGMPDCGLQPRRDPYCQLERRLSLGYRRSKKKASGSQHVRRFDGDKYHFARLGSADDYDTANGTTILSYAEASRAALACANEAVRAKPQGKNPNYTVGDCVDDYLAWHAIYRKARTGRATSWTNTSALPLGR